MPMAGMPIGPPMGGAATTASIPAAICSSPASPAHWLPGVVNVATVTYRTHVYDTPAYPSVFYGYPPHARLYDLTPGPIYNKPCFC